MGVKKDLEATKPRAYVFQIPIEKNEKCGAHSLAPQSSPSFAKGISPLYGRAAG